jgi:oligoribonuclease (3'-5' exoribonuclease)
VLVKESLNSEWLTSILLSAHTDSFKEQQARETLYEVLKQKIDEKALGIINGSFIEILNSDFAKMRSLKQSVYYRTRSINSILKFIESYKPNALARKIKGQNDMQTFFDDLRDEYLEKSQGPRYTKNSYVNEFMAFIYDIYPEISNDPLSHYEKSLDRRISQSMDNLSSVVANNSRIVAMQEDLSTFDLSIKKDKAIGENDKLNGKWEFSVHPDSGMVAKYAPSNITEEKLRLMEAEVILSSINASELCEIEVQLQTRPIKQILVKPVGEIDIKSVAKFREFIEQVFPE